MSPKQDRGSMNPRTLGKLLVAIHALLVVANCVTLMRQSDKSLHICHTRPATRPEIPTPSTNKTPAPEINEGGGHLAGSIRESSTDDQSQKQGPTHAAQKPPLLEREITSPRFDLIVIVVLFLALAVLHFYLHFSTEVQRDSLFGFSLTGVGLLASLGDNAFKVPKRYMKWLGLTIGLIGLAISMCSILAAIPNS